MTTILQPRVSLALASAEREVENTPQKVLLVGQMTSAGSATDGALVENISSSDSPENALFGKNSQLASMVRHFKAVNGVNQVDAIALDDAGGATARAVTIEITGTSTEAGTLIVIAGSQVDHLYQVPVTFDAAAPTAEDESTIAAKINVLINADTECPFTSTVLAGVVTLTAVNAGTVANDLGVSCSGAVGGITGQEVLETVPGLTDPSLDVLAVATDRYQGVVWCWSNRISAGVTQLDEVRDWLLPRFNADNAILDGVAFAGNVASYADTLTLLGELNSHDVVIFADEATTEAASATGSYLGPAQNEASYNKAAIFAGIRAVRLTPDQSISRFLVSSASKDQFGGTALASLPYFNTVLSDLPGVGAGRGWTDTEIEALAAAGGSVMGVNKNGDTGLAGEVVTTYLTDGAGNPDVTFTFLNYVDTSSNIREYYFNNYKKRFSQSRLTEGELSQGRDIANALSIASYSQQLYQDLSSDEFVLVQSGEAAFDFYKQNLTIDLDLALGKVTIVMFVPIVTQLRTIIGTIKIAFSTT